MINGTLGPAEHSSNFPSLPEVSGLECNKQQVAVGVKLSSDRQNEVRCVHLKQFIKSQRLKPLNCS